MPHPNPHAGILPRKRLLGVIDRGAPPGEARRLASLLEIPLLETAPAAPAGMVVEWGERLAVRPLGTGAPRPVAAAFDDPGYRRRLRQATPRREPLARALGLHRRRPDRVVDGTGGLGRDAMILAWLGIEVLLVERHPLLARMLEDGLARARNHPELAAAAHRITLDSSDTVDLLRHKAVADEHFQAIYLDPMYPAGPRRGGPAREAQILQLLVPPPDDEAELLAAALASGVRVVVKRPRKAGPLDGRAPHHAIEGRAVRFDVYEGG